MIVGPDRLDSDGTTPTTFHCEAKICYLGVAIEGTACSARARLRALGWALVKEGLKVGPALRGPLATKWVRAFLAQPPRAVISREALIAGSANPWASGFR